MFKNQNNKKEYKKILKCHCGAVEAKINMAGNFKKLLDVIAHYVKERVQ